MAAPTLTLLNHTLLSSADAATGWFDTVTIETDIKVEGSGSMSGVLRADAEVSYYDSTTAPITAAGKTVRGWFNTTNVPYLEIKANNGLELYVYDGSTIETKAIAGIDTYAGGWLNYIWDMDTFTTLTLANVRRWGVRQQLTSNAKNVVNAWHDVIRYLDGYSMTGGTSGDKVRLADIALYDKGTTTLRAYGVVTEVNSVFFCTGTVQFGTGATAHYFEMDGQILVFTDQMVRSGLYSLSGVGSGTNVVIKNSVIRSAGTTDATRFVFDWDEANLAACTIIDNLIVRAGACSFKNGQTMTGNTFDNCGQITAAGANLSDAVIKGYEGTADTAALVWNVATDPDGYLYGIAFTKGTAATHAISFGTSSPVTMTIRGMSFSGYNASDGQTDSVLYFADKGSDITWTINASGCSGTVSYKKARSGDTVTILADQVTLTIEVRDSDGAIITDSTEITLVRSSDLTVLSHAEDVTSGSTGYTYGYSGDVNCYVNVLSVANYVPRTVEPVVLGDTDQTVVVQLEDERGRYSNP